MELRDAGVVDDLRREAEDIAVAGTKAGYRLDFRPSSLWEVERLLDEHSPHLGGVLANPKGDGHSVFALGGYVGEVVRRRVGGHWRWRRRGPRG